uniref:Uncharacterized protein n=1 Tax=Amicula sp. isolate GU52X-4 cfCalB7 TaxID=3003489 RepID=A0A9E8YZ62_9STRA|nr:hypothetical protein [Amicula sp. isolate GU52X-4 cfCalB7]
MKTSRIKDITIIGPSNIDIFNDCLDIYVTLKDDELVYDFTVITPQVLISEMERKKQKFVEPQKPAIIVQELTPAVIKEAIEAHLTDENSEDYDLEDYHDYDTDNYYSKDYWFKSYYANNHLTRRDLDLIINRRRKIQAEKDKDWEEEED